MEKKIEYTDAASRAAAIAANPGLRIKEEQNHSDGKGGKINRLIFTDAPPEDNSPLPPEPMPIDPRIQAVLDDYEARISALEAPKKPAPPAGGGGA